MIAVAEIAAVTDGGRSAKAYMLLNAIERLDHDGTFRRPHVGEVAAPPRPATTPSPPFRRSTACGRAVAHVIVCSRDQDGEGAQCLAGRVLPLFLQSGERQRKVSRLAIA